MFTITIPTIPLLFPPSSRREPKNKESKKNKLNDDPRPQCMPRRKSTNSRTSYAQYFSTEHARIMKLCSSLPFLLAAVVWGVSPAEALIVNSSQCRFRNQYSNGCTNLAAATLDIVDVNEQQQKDPLLYFLSPPPPIPSRQQQEANEARANAERMYSMSQELDDAAQHMSAAAIIDDAAKDMSAAAGMYSVSQILDDSAQEISTAAIIDDAARDVSAAAALIESVDRILTRLTPHLSESQQVGQSASVPRENDR